MAKLCRSVCGETRFLIPAAWATEWTARQNWRADSGSTKLRPGNSQPPGSSRLRRRLCLPIMPSERSADGDRRAK